MLVGACGCAECTAYYEAMKRLAPSPPVKVKKPKGKKKK